MAVNKITLNTASGERVLIDLTGLNVKPETLCEGTTAMNAAGELISGTALTITDVTIEEV